MKPVLYNSFLYGDDHKVSWKFSVAGLGCEAALVELVQSRGSTSRVTFNSGRIAPWGFGKQQSCKSAAGV
jgi:hypothetical protein